MKGSKGMTLLEVLLALAIFASASLAVLRAVTQHIESVSYLEDKTFASMVADNQLAMSVLDPKRVRSQTGETELGNRTWYWQIRLVPTTNNYLQAYDVKVSKQKDGSPIVSVRNYVQKSQLQK